MADFDRGGKAFAIILFIVAIAGDRVVIPAVGRPGIDVAAQT